MFFILCYFFCLREVTGSLEVSGFGACLGSLCTRHACGPGAGMILTDTKEAHAKTLRCLDGTISTFVSSVCVRVFA